MTSEFPGAVPEIPVRDISVAVGYYEGNLGFTVDYLFRIFYDFATPERLTES